MRRWMLCLIDKKEVIRMQEQKCSPPRIPQQFRWIVGYNASAKYKSKF